MDRPPALLAEFDMGRHRPEVTSVDLAGGRGRIGVAIVAGTLRAYRPDGTLRWECHPSGLNFTSLAAAFDGGGHTLLALKAGRPAEPFGAVVLVSAEDGTVVWRYDVDPVSYIWDLLVGSYLPGTNARQLIVLMQGYPPDTRNGYIALFHFPKAGEPPAQKWRYDFDQYTCYPRLHQANLRGDGIRDLAIISHSRMWVLDPATGHKNQFIQWDVSPANVRSYGLSEFTDLDGDGRDDFLCIGNFSQHHEVLLNVGGQFKEAWHQGWAESVITGHVATTYPVPAHGDVDGDGHQEIVVSMYDSAGEGKWLVRVYDAKSGKLKYTQPGMIAAALVDVDGDGSLEILADLSDDPTAGRPDGSASPSDHKGACVLKVVGGELKIVWQDPQARVVRGASRGGPHMKRGGVPWVLSRGVGGNIVGSPWVASALALAPAKAEFSTVPPALGPASPQLLAADFYGTGRNDLLLYREGLATLLRPRPDRSFETLATFPSACLPVVADLDGTGKPALVLAEAGPGIVPSVRAVSPAVGGKVLWQVRFPEPAEGLPQPQVAYLRAGHFTGRRGADVYAWFGTPAVRSLVLDGHDGHTVWQKQRLPAIERYWGPSQNLASVWDFNGDGKDDLVFTNPDYFCVASGPTGDLLLGPSLPATIFHQRSQGLYTLPALLLPAGTEGKGDPTVCLVGGHYFQGAMSVRAEPHWYKLPEIGQARSGREGFLRTPEGRWLMGFGRQNGKFACVNVADGSLRWEFDVAASCTDAISFDVAGTGNPAFVFGTSHGELLALEDRGGSPHVLWRISVGSPIVGSPVAADLTGAGHCQLIICGADGRVRLYGPTIVPKAR